MQLIDSFFPIQPNFFNKLLFNHNIADPFQNNEKPVQTISNDFSDGFYPNIKQTAEAFDVPPRIFQKQVQKINSRISKPITYRSGFKCCSKQVLFEYIQRLDIIGQSFKPNMFKNNAYYILQLVNPEIPRRVGFDWVIRFITQ